MAGLGIGIAFVGYSVMYYGVTQVQGGNWGLLDLVLPSKWATAALTPRDDGTTLSGKQASTTSKTVGGGGAIPGGSNAGTAALNDAAGPVGGRILKALGL
jgi:hypothetical protein